jgi:hypothetical protein
MYITIPFPPETLPAGAISAYAPILGLSASYDTLEEISAAVEEFAAFQSAVDSNADNRIDPENQAVVEFLFPTPTLTWNIAHGLGKVCSATLLDSAGAEFLSTVSYSDANTMIIRHSIPTSGKAVLR